MSKVGHPLPQREQAKRQYKHHRENKVVVDEVDLTAIDRLAWEI
jgi:hypothetical protein